jgi:hypothetical protein
LEKKSQIGSESSNLTQIREEIGQEIVEEITDTNRRRNSKRKLEPLEKKMTKSKGKRNGYCIGKKEEENMKEREKVYIK